MTNRYHAESVKLRVNKCVCVCVCVLYADERGTFHTKWNIIVVVIITF